MSNIHKSGTAPRARVHLALLPTPLQRLPRLSEKTGVDFWIKRDDLSGDLGLTGNKVRKLEFLLAEARNTNCTHLVTIGGPQSNHARTTAAAAGRPYVIPLGGSSPTGILGSIECYSEMASSLHENAWVCLAAGSTGTQAGLILGAVQSGHSMHIQGFSVLNSADVARAQMKTQLIETGKLIGKTLSPNDFSIHLDDAFMGPSYGVASEKGQEAAQLLARLEGIILDPVYTSKAMAGVLTYIQQGTIAPGTQVVFVHTGGAPSIFS